MSEQQFQIARAVGFVVALVTAMVLQGVRPHARLRGSWLVNGGLWLTNFVVIGAVCGACACTVARWTANAGVGLLHAAPAPRWFGVATTIVALDLVSYCWHRANHQIAFLWRFHQVHHSDPTFTASTALRFHPGELLLSLPLRLGAIAALGSPAVAVVAFEILFTMANFLEHSDIDLPLGFERVVGRVLVTPALHRQHHTKVVPERDTNFGTIFVVWDRFFATRKESDSTAVIETGLPAIGPLSLRRVLTLPIQGTVA